MKKENKVLEAFAKINATPEYVAKNEIAVHAISEIVKNEDISIVTKEQCIEWLNRYKHIFKNFKGRSPIFYPTLKEFFEIYMKIKSHIECLGMNNQILTALADFKEVNLEEENSLLEWLVYYEDLNHNLPYFKVSNNKEHVILSEEHKLYLEGTEFNNAIEFESIFSQYYIDMLVKFKLDLCSRTALNDSLEVLELLKL